MLKALDSLVVLLALGALSGCAGLEMHNLAKPEDEAAARGFRYYESSPFLLVYTDGKGGLATELMYLPDTTKKRSIRPYAYGASNDALLTFSNGVMKSAKAVVDETAVPVAVIQGLEKVAISLAKAANAQSGGIPPPRLYRVRRDDKSGLWKLEGGETVGPDGKLAPLIRYQ